MVIRTCDICIFSTKYKNVFDNHVKSFRHIKRQSNINIEPLVEIEPENTLLEIENSVIIKDDIMNESISSFIISANCCTKCNKNYKTRSGLWKHKKTCKILEQNAQIPVELIQQMIDTTAQLHNEIKELKEIQVKTVTVPSSIINNNTNNNTTNNNNIHIYLNTHCSNAMSIDQFVDSMKFVKDDFNEIDKNRFYYQGATNILKKYFQQLKLEDRPMHCASPIVNKPAAFFVRDENQWKEECQSMAHYQMKYIEEFENKEEQMAVTRFFEKFNEKLYETYKELSVSDKQMERRINDKMMGGGSKDKIDMLDELADSKCLTLHT